MSSLNVQVEELSPVVRRLQIDVPADRVTQVTDSVYRRLGSQVRIPGYRQGPVQRRVLEKHFASQVKTAVAREVVQTTFDEALQTAQISPVSEPTVEPEELKIGESFRYSARVEVRPKVQLQTYKGLEVSAPDATVPDTAVDARIEELRVEHSTLVPIEGRDEAQTGDYGDVTWELKIEGEAGEPRKSEGGLVRVEPGLFVEGHGEKLIGQKVGETREFSEVFTAEAEAALAGKTAFVKATLTGLKKRELPEVDDEFAKDARGAETVDLLKAAVRKELEIAKTRESELARNEAILDQLIEKNPLEVPPALVDFSATRMASDFLSQILGRDLRGQQLDASHPLVERLKKDALPRATRDMKVYFLMEAVAEAEGIKVSADDLNQWFEKTAADQGQPVEKLRARYKTPDALARLSEIIRNDRAMDLLVANAKVTVAPPKAEDEATNPPTESGANG